MFINISNHPFPAWSDLQRDAAMKLGGDIVDLPFPLIDPEMGTEQLDILVDQYYGKIMEMLRSGKNTPCQENTDTRSAVMVQGEYTFVYRLVKRLEQKGILCVSACSRREVEEERKGDTVVKKSLFQFLQFRRYF